MRAREFPTDKVERIHLVPTRAVSYVYGANKTYVVASDVIQAREVKLGDRFGENVEIVEGRADGRARCHYAAFEARHRCESPRRQRAVGMKSRREILYLGAGFFATAASTTAADLEIEEATITQLQAGLTGSQWTAVDLVRKYRERIENIDRNGPKLNSVIELNPDAESIAAALDRERKEKGSRGPLHGIPILIKDNIDTGDKMMTTAGSLALVDAPVPKDAPLVTRLRAAGAVILGKTNLSEWANFRSSHSTSGWSARGGQTRNPYALDRNPSGSSSGSGVAVAASLCAAAVGTETDGSIISPSSINGIVGIKPSVGLVPGEGHRADFASSGHRRSHGAHGGGRGAIAVRARRCGLRTRARSQRTAGARIGVARQIFGFNDHVDRLMESALALLKQQGAVLIDPATISTYSKLNEPENEALQWEFKEDLNAYLAARGGSVKSLKT
jgi:amidase